MPFLYRPFLILLVLATYNLLLTYAVLTNADGKPINQGASSSFVPWRRMRLSDGWTVQVSSESDITFWVPVEYTAARLEKFWQSIYEMASRHFWSASASFSSFAIHQGALSLFLLPTPTSGPIPWHVFAQFAWAMLDAAKRGYTAGFSVRLRSPQDVQSGPFSEWLTALFATSPGVLEASGLPTGDRLPPD